MNKFFEKRERRLQHGNKENYRKTETDEENNKKETANCFGSNSYCYTPGDHF